MISVQNHQPLLSGSKIWVALIATIVLFSACGGNRRLPKDTQIVKSDKPSNVPSESTRPEKNSTKVDTAEWVVVNKKPPITEAPKSSGNVKTGNGTPTNLDGFKEVYEVAMFIPLNSRKYLNGQVSDDSYLEYYCGAKIAAEKLNLSGIQMNIDVIDADNNKTLPQGKEYDIIITANDKQHVADMIAYGKENKKLVISPWYSNSKATENNPYYLQLNPNLREHFTKIVQHAVSKFKPEDIVLVGLDKKQYKSWFKFLQAKGKEITGKENPFVEHFVSKDSLELGTWVFGELLEENKKAFIIPNYSFNDETHIYSVMRRLSAERGEHVIHVYGMPIIIESDKIDFDFYNNLNLKVPISEFIDDDDYNVKAFQSRYYTLYNDLPASDAYQGHDLMMFIGETVKQHGIYFPAKVAGENPKEYLQTSYHIFPVAATADEDAEEVKGKVDFFENKRLYIIEFKNGKFQKSK